MTARRITGQRSRRPTFSVGFISLGCAKNLVDAQIMAGTLLEEGITLAPAPEQADVIVVNTCAFIKDARDESTVAIRSACRLKAAGRCRAVVVAGCLPQRQREAVVEEFPAVDAVIGVDALRKLGDVVRRLQRGESGISEISGAARRLFEPGRRLVVLSGGPYAYVKIAEGCNHRCSFCAIPGIRGKYRSRPIARIVREAERLLEAGCSELDLVSQDTTAFGMDLPGKQRLPDLLRALGGIGGKFWIRLLYGYPTRVTDELLEVMGETPGVCRYVDVPVQHADPAVLRAMRRADTVRAVESLPDRVRRALPGVALRTTCLLGHPGETDAGFHRLLRYVEESRFDHLGAFVFSPEDGTPAAALPGRPASDVAERRRGQLLERQLAIAREHGARRIGSRMEVLLERPARDADTTAWVARSAGQAPEVDGVTLVRGVPGTTRPGTFARVRVAAARDYDLDAVWETEAK
jgi:ribosomal protein S12 methylthiotransferase